MYGCVAFAAVVLSIPAARVTAPTPEKAPPTCCAALSPQLLPISSSAEQPEAPSSAAREQDQTLTAVLPIDSLEDWLRARDRLQAVPAIRKVTVAALSRQEATIAIDYTGTIEQLKSELAKINLDLVRREFAMAARPRWRRRRSLIRSEPLDTRAMVPEPTARPKMPPSRALHPGPALRLIELNLNLPNAITLARLASVPLVIGLVLGGRYAAAFWVFIGAGLSDAVDGYIAKRFDRRTPLGAVLDPVADKALLTGLYLTLLLTGHLPGWLVSLVVLRDALIVGRIPRIAGERRAAPSRSPLYK